MARFRSTIPLTSTSVSPNRMSHPPIQISYPRDAWNRSVSDALISLRVPLRVGTAVLYLIACTNGATEWVLRSTAPCPTGTGSVETWCNDEGHCELRVSNGGTVACTPGDSDGCSGAALDACRAAAVPVDGGMGSDADVERSDDICVQYVRCIAATNPGGLGLVSEQYAAGGSCWRTTPELCSGACLTGLRQNHEAFPGEPACPECISNAQCSGATPVCDRSSGECVRCASDADCGSTAPACDRSTNTCVACITDAHCPSSRPACDRERRACVECTSFEHCGADRPHCHAPTQRCVPCLRDANCPSNAPRCDSSNWTCSADCREDSHCPAATPYCAYPSLITPRYRCVECQLDHPCAPSATCDGGACRPQTCEDPNRRCGDHRFDDGVVLQCGTCADPMLCDQRNVGGRDIFTCGLPLESPCELASAATCGEGYRCVPPLRGGFVRGSTNRCAIDVTGRSCSGACRYWVNEYWVNDGICDEGVCRSICYEDAHCVIGERCLRNACVPQE